MTNKHYYTIVSDEKIPGYFVFVTQTRGQKHFYSNTLLKRYETFSEYNTEN